MADISSITLPNGSSYNFKDTTARSDLTSKAIASTWLVRDRKYSATTSVAARGAVATTIDVTASGYTAICIVGSGSTNTNATWCFPYRWSLNSNTATVSVRNNGTGAASIQTFVDILYKLN